MRFSPRFLDEIRDRASLGDLVGRKVKLARAGRELKGLCPFHTEKTPSFHVVEDKGFYHCFGCGAHGDALGWLMEAEGLSFPEAVEQLASLAGVPLPTPDPEERRRAEEAADLHDVLESATRFFSRQLGGAAGREARDYLKARGLDQETISHFRLGFAPEEGDALRQALVAEGIAESALIEAGLIKKPEEGGRPFAYFRNRIIFPIGDRRGRIIAFGGRALDQETRAKYLNSPETALFHKGRTLYNLAGARKAAQDSGLVIAVEGYIDVIALRQAGMPYAVAPLGTALTEEQLAELWKMAPEPVLCFDGDKAGLRAAERAIERALPMLAPGHSLRFALLPEGADPDDLVRREGRTAMERIIAAAEPLADRLWAMTGADRDVSTPERRAGFEKDLRDRINLIRDEKVKGFYHRDAGDRLYRAFAAKGRGKARGKRPDSRMRLGGEPASVGLKSSRIGRNTDNNGRRLYEQLLCLYALNHPELGERHLEELAAVRFADSELDKLRQELLVTLSSGKGLDRSALKNHLIQSGFKDSVARLESSPLLRPAWSAWPQATASEAGIGLEHVLARLRRLAMEDEIADLERAYRETGSDDLLMRLIQLKRDHHRSEGNEAEVEGYVFRS